MAEEEKRRRGENEADRSSGCDVMGWQSMGSIGGERRDAAKRGPPGCSSRSSIPRSQGVGRSQMGPPDQDQPEPEGEKKVKTDISQGQFLVGRRIVVVIMSGNSLMRLTPSCKGWAVGGLGCWRAIGRFRATSPGEGGGPWTQSECDPALI
ncbi:hypothetical protein BO78DRAFT_27835 [Aspergillus sclerotiicarbonarius CBS 121057]|uniref:Uncharacterized protein n=1 Tax=Aspergillus sclerotiicarbonarius (strain CBS 121057 / IBT 28362) TaxID=1448318 RepID=A0A319DTF3_ASPSB|nr:hypothetical protein BO78DRAFT_27835 [Aspergillus sclerotiicarbonarius CBS 121057]